MHQILAIAAGGALGAVLRHIVNMAATAAWGASFPWGIIIANIAGSFVMGVLAGAFAEGFTVPESLKLFLTVGLLGGFTTFSSFSLDAVTMIERGAVLAAGAYVAASVVFAIAGLWLGMVVARGVAA